MNILPQKITGGKSFSRFLIVAIGVFVSLAVWQWTCKDRAPDGKFYILIASLLIGLFWFGSQKIVAMSEGLVYTPNFLFRRRKIAWASIVRCECEIMQNYKNKSLCDTIVWITFKENNQAELNFVRLSSEFFQLKDLLKLMEIVKEYSKAPVNDPFVVRDKKFRSFKRRLDALGYREPVSFPETLKNEYNYGWFVKFFLLLAVVAAGCFVFSYKVAGIGFLVTAALIALILGAALISWTTLSKEGVLSVTLFFFRKKIAWSDLKRASYYPNGEFYLADESGKCIIVPDGLKDADKRMLCKAVWENSRVPTLVIKDGSIYDFALEGNPNETEEENYELDDTDAACGEECDEEEEYNDEYDDDYAEESGVKRGGQDKDREKL